MITYLEWLGLVSVTLLVVIFFVAVIYAIIKVAKEAEKEDRIEKNIEHQAGVE